VSGANTALSPSGARQRGIRPSGRGSTVTYEFGQPGSRSAATGKRLARYDST
jgi:hypothetical protein